MPGAMRAVQRRTLPARSLPRLLQRAIEDQAGVSRRRFDAERRQAHVYLSRLVAPKNVTGKRVCGILDTLIHIKLIVLLFII